jgi:hypothetical protein
MQTLSPRAARLYLMRLDDLWTSLFPASLSPASGLTASSCSDGRRVVLVLPTLLMPLQDPEPATAAALKKLSPASAARQKLDTALPAFTKACEPNPKRRMPAIIWRAPTRHWIAGMRLASHFENALRAAPKPILAACIGPPL